MRKPGIRLWNCTRGVELASRVDRAGWIWPRLKGLLPKRRKEDFPQGSALWLIPCKEVHTLGMAFPIDLLYLDESGLIVEACSEVPPWRVAPARRRAHSVIELPSGTLRATGTLVGDQLEFMPVAGQTREGGGA